VGTRKISILKALWLGLLLTFFIPHSEGAPWIPLSTDDPWTNYRLDAGSIVELAESRMALAEYSTLLEGSQRTVKRLFEVDCKKKAVRTLLLESSDDLNPFHAINRDKPDWIEAKNFRTGYLPYEMCKAKPPRRQKKLQFIFGAISVESFGLNVQINSIVDFRMPLIGGQLGVNVLATDCENGFGNLKADGNYTVSLGGKTRPDITFWYLCTLGMAEAYAFDERRRQEKAAAGITPEEDYKALSRAILLRQLLDRERPSPASPPQKTKTETVCKFDSLSQSTKCETVEKPCIYGCE